jgi:hypothetical protein
MPSMIKLVRDRAEVTDNFKAALNYISRRAFSRVTREMDSAPDYMRVNLARTKHPVLKNLARICTYNDSFDNVITRLRALPFTKYCIAEYNELNWISATTKPIMGEGNFAPFGKRREKYPQMQTWALGQYEILIRINGFCDCDMTGIHMIPLLDPTIRARHMHHRLDRKWTGLYSGGTLEQHTENYMAENPKTCWGEFPNLVSSSMSDGDLVEFLRIIHIFLSRLNPLSPLEGITNLTFATRVN